MAYLLDTCAILFIAQKTENLSAATLERIEEASPGEVSVSAISVAELACLQEGGKISLKPHWRRWWETLLSRTGWSCLPITGETLAEAYSLPAPIHRDPADRILIATARVERLTIVTADARILAYPHVASVA